MRKTSHSKSFNVNCFFLLALITACLFLITSNRIYMDYEYDGQIGQYVSIGPPEEYTLYRDFEPVCSFSLDDVSGIDFSIHEMSHVCHVGNHILFQSYSMAKMDGDCGWIAVAKSDMEAGVPEPFLVG